MKSILLAAAALGVMGMAPTSAPTGVSVTSIGGSSAESCYHAAAARDASEQAMRNCNDAIGQEVIPFNDLVASHVNRGVLKLVRGDTRAAESDFDQALSLQRTQPEAWLNKGIARYKQGDAKGAAQMFTRALELRTTYPALAYFGRGLANEDSGNIRAAYADLRKAVELNPRWDAPQRELARYQVVRRPAA